VGKYEKGLTMLNGIMLLWFILTAMSVVFVAIDIRSTPESPVLKWGFILLVAYTGPIGAFLYVLGCREPLEGLHERYVATRWRQVLGSTMHCVAGDGIGILVGAAVASYFTLSHPIGMALEYILGFGFGWTIFQALFMREMAGSYRQSLAKTFLPEFLSMNVLMTGMMPVAALGRILVGRKLSPSEPAFWYVMSMALLVGFIVAYPMNWWLVAKELKHGMITQRDPQMAHTSHTQEQGASQEAVASPNKSHASQGTASRKEIVWMILLSVILFALAVGATEILLGRYGQMSS
jgi:hypothetical protein